MARRLLLVLLATGVAGAAWAGEYVKPVNGVNVRSGPSTSTSIAAKLAHGTEVDVLEVKATAAGERWKRTPKGWIRADLLAMKAPAAPAAPAARAAPTPAPQTSFRDCLEPRVAECRANPGISFEACEQHARQACAHLPGAPTAGAGTN